MNLFESERYTPFMFIAISLVTLLILFNFINILGDTKSGVDLNNKIGLTGLAVGDVEGGDEKTVEEEIVGDSSELYTVKAYSAYYFIIIILGICIFVLSFRYFLPFLKRNS